jgi:uncharacterized membrane protein
MPFVVNHILGKKAFYHLFGATLIAELISFVFFAFIPTKQDPYAYEQAYT